MDVQTDCWELNESADVASEGSAVEAGPASSTMPDPSLPLDSVAQVVAKAIHRLLASLSLVTDPRSVGWTQDYGQWFGGYYAAIISGKVFCS
jgi:hypothetical protein